MNFFVKPAYSSENSGRRIVRDKNCIGNVRLLKFMTCCVTFRSIKLYFFKKKKLKHLFVIH